MKDMQILYRMSALLKQYRKFLSHPISKLLLVSTYGFHMIMKRRESLEPILIYFWIENALRFLKIVI